ncbi:MAG: type II toxin-antitoxin system prevent-host-death family antitoxin [Thalassobaculum sp.]|uniref:type II toxin-antitoxin system Phd/YefM family antitoxin n=1 Tax=Thalassobaculum sp. TaxID=2022740 RepID=UPI0032EAB6A0
MDHVSYTELRRNLARHMDEVSASKAPLLVTRQGGKSVVVLAEDEYEALRETLHLLSSPANAARLMRGLAEADAGQVSERPWDDPSERPA